MSKRKPLDPVTRYATDVVNGRLVDGVGIDCTSVVLACQRHLRDLEDGPARGLVWRPEKAQEFFDFVQDCLCLPDVEKATGDGPPTAAPFVLTDYEKFIGGSVFGWWLTDDTLRFVYVFLLMSKGQGKTPLAVAILLFRFVVMGGKGTQAYSAAPTLDQSKLAFTDAKLMIEASPELSELFDVRDSNLAIIGRASFLRPISAEKRGLDGKRVSIAIVDELQEHRDGVVVDKVTAGTKGCQNPIVIVPTNAGYDRESVCWRETEYSLQILKGTVVNDSWFAFIVHLDACQTHRAEGHIYAQSGCAMCDRWDVEGPHWLKANPGLGVTIPWRYLREQVRKAIGMPSKANIVRRLNFSEWTENETAVITADQWNACKAAIDWSAYKGRPGYVGIDLSSTRDITAAVWIFPEDDGGITILPRLYTPEASMRSRAERDRIPYDEWIAGGHIRAMPGLVINDQIMRADLNEDAELFAAREAGYDGWQAESLAADLTGDGWTMVKVRQGFQTMAEPTRKLLDLVIEGKVRHDGNPAFGWMACNLVVKFDPAGNMRPSRENRTLKVDGIVALLNGLSRVLVDREDDKEFVSVYESRGALVL